MKILTVFAHPDDESFGPGGTLARCAREGHTIRLVTLTRGEAGSLGGLSPAQLAEVRTRELRCAARELGIASVRIYELPDKRLQDMDGAQGVEIVAEEMRKFRPDLVITFHPNGISGHPDHQTASRWALSAVQAQTPSPRLFYYGLTEQQTRMVPNRPLRAIPSDEITHRIDVLAYLPDKIRAIKCHESQRELWEQFQSLPVDYREFARFEHFSQVVPLPGWKGVRKTLE